MNGVDPNGQDAYLASHYIITGTVLGFINLNFINNVLSFFGVQPPTHTFFVLTVGSGGLDDPGTSSVGFGPGPGTSNMTVYPAGQDLASINTNDSLYGWKRIGGDDVAASITIDTQEDRNANLGQYDALTNNSTNSNSGAATEIDILQSKGQATDLGVNGETAVRNLGGDPVGAGKTVPTMVSVSPGTVDWSNPNRRLFTDPNSSYFGQPEWDLMGGGQEVGAIGGFDPMMGGGGAGTPGNNFGWFLPRPLK